MSIATDMQHLPLDTFHSDPSSARLGDRPTRHPHHLLPSTRIFDRPFHYKRQNQGALSDLPARSMRRPRLDQGRGCPLCDPEGGVSRESQGRGRSVGGAEGEAVWECQG